MHGIHGSTEEPRRVTAYVGISEGSEDEPATVEAAIHDAAIQAVADGMGDRPLNVVSIEFTAHNPHITAYKIIATPKDT
jgi:hypothetical protein